jgi:hypothetical protein
MVKRLQGSHRHGDVGLIPATLPRGVTPKMPKISSKGGAIIAEGELTGHCHIFANPSAVQFYLDQETSTEFVEVKEEVWLTHEEHPAQKIEPGVYQYVPQVERTLLGEIQKVRD